MSFAAISTADIRSLTLVFFGYKWCGISSFSAQMTHPLLKLKCLRLVSNEG